MNNVRSKDGTLIAYERSGSGAPVILVDGALCYRESGPARPLAAMLAGHFTVYTYDRRGRGSSGDTAPYSVEREVEDIEALIAEAGGSACVYGISSGGALALEAAARLKGIRKLALYEIPFIVDDSIPPQTADYNARMSGLIADNRRGDAVRMFMKTVGVPGIFIALMRVMPMWPKLTAVAHTLPYDFAVLGDNRFGKPLPRMRWSSVSVPTLVMDGGKSPAWMRSSMRAVAGVLPTSTYRTIDGQTHMLKPKAITPILIDFFEN